MHSLLSNSHFSPSKGVMELKGLKVGVDEGIPSSSVFEVLILNIFVALPKASILIIKGCLRSCELSTHRWRHLCLWVIFMLAVDLFCVF